MGLITKITRENERILASFELIKKKIEENNILLLQKNDSLIRASINFMSSTIYSDANGSDI